MVPDNLSGVYGREEYVEALKCLNGRLISAIDHIQATDPSSVIILQGDHGPDFAGLWRTPLSDWTAEQIKIKFGVFSAMRLPEGCTPPFDMSLVNTFRIVFDCLANEGVSLIPGKIWLAHYEGGEIREAKSP